MNNVPLRLAKTPAHPQRIPIQVRTSYTAPTLLPLSPPTLLIEFRTKAEEKREKRNK